MQLTANQRTALRSAIVANMGWPAYKSATGKSISEMSKDEILSAARALKIDIEAVIDCGANTDTSTETSTATESKNTMKVEHVATEETPKIAIPSFDKNDAGKPLWDLTKGHAMAELWAMISPQIEKALSNVSTIKIEMTSNGVAVGESTGHHHPMFSTLCRILSSRAADGFVPNVWIAGPAGSGKTHSVKSFAKAAGLEFYYNGALRDAFELIGYKDANGVYHTTPFRQAYEHGGVYLFDEVDGSDNAALLALNGALANGIASFPDGLIERHPDCRIVATGNTWGLGATSDYVGRGKIDAAFLDRFGARLQWGYDVALEVSISGNADFAKRVQAARTRAVAAGLKVLITPRASIAGAALIAAGLTHDEAADLTYLANLSKEQRAIVEGRA
jgi:cobaltochelatase CobS